MQENQRGHEWHAIEPLSALDEELDLADAVPLYESWRSFKKSLKDSESLAAFTERLVRSLSIETGILERVYDLDRGTTKILVAKGLLEDLVRHDATNLEPSALIQILKDHEAAIHLVQDLSGGIRPLTRGVILEIHAILMRHHHTTVAIDQFGSRMDVPLVKGAYKTLPNNVVLPDGAIHEYCPPEHVASEVDRLLELHASYEGRDPLLVAAWFHHRFTQIHPFQDGNGRVARVLSAYILLKAGLLPIVVDRDRREDYLTALREGDSGRIEKLVRLFVALEKNAILHALSFDLETEPSARSLVGAVAAGLAAKFSRRREQRAKDLLRVNDVAHALRDRATAFIESNLREFRSGVFNREEPVPVFVVGGGPDEGNAHWYKHELVELNEDSDKWIEFGNGHYFVKATLRFERVRLVFVVSFHHIGRRLSGVMEVTTFADIETYDEAEPDRGDRIGTKLLPACVDPFVLTWKTEADAVSDSFTKWLDHCLAIALKEWGDRL